MSYQEISASRARELLAEDGHIYLDVRTVEEFVAGHPPDAWNLPVMVINAATGERAQNSEFLRVAQANLAKDGTLVVGCKTGYRSSVACDLLAQAGYRNLYNVRGGFAGIRDRGTGGIVTHGWSTLGYPIEQGDGDVHSYEELLTKSTP